MTLRYPSVSMLVCASALLAFAAGTEARRAEGQFHQAVKVGDRADLDIVTGAGRIEIRQGPAGVVDITGRVKAGDNWGASSPFSPEERVRKIEADPPIAQTGNSVRVGHNPVVDGVSISYVVTVPPGTRVVSKTGSGDQEIDVDGAVEIQAGSGSLEVRRASDVRASTGSGDIAIDSIAGDVQASAGSGTIHVAAAKGAVRASTGSGGLHIEGALSRDWNLSASSGHVTVDLPKTQRFELDATTNSGGIDVDFPVTMTGTKDRRSVRGAVNGGGPLLRIRTSSGGISIQ